MKYETFIALVSHWFHFQQ